MNEIGFDEPESGDFVFIRTKNGNFTVGVLGTHIETKYYSERHKEVFHIAHSRRDQNLKKFFKAFYPGNFLSNKQMKEAFLDDRRN